MLETIAEGDDYNVPTELQIDVGVALARMADIADEVRG
jgi:hypothetical protein